MSREGAPRLPDMLDRASELSQRLNDAAVDHARHLAKPEQTQNADGSWPQTECDDCGEPIGAARLALGKIRCIACQSEREHRQRLGLPL